MLSCDQGASHSTRRDSNCCCDDTKSYTSDCNVLPNISDSHTLQLRAQRMEGPRPLQAVLPIFARLFDSFGFRLFFNVLTLLWLCNLELLSVLIKSGLVYRIDPVLIEQNHKLGGKKARQIDSKCC